MPLRIGCQISIRRGYYGAAQTAQSLGLGAFQYFPKNPRSLGVKAFDYGDASRCAVFAAEAGLISAAHAPYPVNLAAGDARLGELTAQSLLNDLEIAAACGSVGVVVHFGKFREKDSLQGYRNIIQCLDGIASAWKGGALILLENQASGPGTALEEMVSIRSLCRRPEMIGFCFDTCHAFASGLWDGRNWESVERRGEELGYWQHLKLVHLNDSRYPSASGKDAHANIGRGRIGKEAFRDLLRSPHIRKRPLILETPAAPGLSVPEEIQVVKELAD